MSGFEELSDLKEQQADITHQRREIEADAFAVMSERPTFFALKLLLGFGHTVPGKKEAMLDQWTEAHTANA